MKKNVRMLTEAAVMIALAFVLSNIRLFQLPNGGSVTPGSMVPLILFAIRWTNARAVDEDNEKRPRMWHNVGICIIVAAVEGTIEFILGPKWSMHPISIIFDYIVAYGVLGLAGVFGKKTANIIIGIVFAVFLRFVCHVISGAVVFYEYAGAQNPWIYSILYNGSFLSLELLITVLITIPLVQVPSILYPKNN
ncbi:MAG: energy-coupled thiamine transporter ThiT [Clostridia bacterium]|jgi:thiamine transporter